MEIILDKTLLNNRDIDFFHYNKVYDLAVYKNYKIQVASRGDLKIEYNNGNIITNNYVDIITNYIKNNGDYLQEYNNGNLIVDLGNWFEIEIYDTNNKYVGSLYEECFGSITECLEVLLKGQEVLDTMIKEYENERR